jgi:hypothetical protein
VTRGVRALAYAVRTVLDLPGRIGAAITIATRSRARADVVVRSPAQVQAPRGSESVAPDPKPVSFAPTVIPPAQLFAISESYEGAPFSVRLAVAAWLAQKSEYGRGLASGLLRSHRDPITTRPRA